MKSRHKPASAEEDLQHFAKEQQQSNKITIIQRVRKIPKKYLLAGSIGMLAALGLIGFLVLRSEPTPEPAASQQEIVEPEPEPEPKPIRVPSPLTGVLVGEQAAARPVTGVMIENGLKARPQSGLLDAGVIFEAVAEGGITRLLALYQEGAPDYLGPIRSSRPYYVEWLAPFDASYVHVGGDIAGRAAISQYITKDLDQFYYGSSFDRVSSRAAPHNVYTDFTRIDALNQGNTSDFSAWPRKDEAPATTPAYTTVNLTISSAQFNPVYTYQPQTNNYARTHGGTPHIDERSGTQMQPKVVIAMQLGYSYYLAEDGYRTSYQTTGSGKAWIFQDGTVVEGTWSKASPTAQIEFKNATGELIELNRGQTWISAVKNASWQ